MRSNKSTWIWAVGIALVVIGLFSWSRFNDPYRVMKKAWNRADIECLASGHTQFAQHIHPHLVIRVDGNEESIPLAGNVTTCMAEIHTHDASGTIHVESRTANKTFTLEQILTVLGLPFARSGYGIQATADGEIIENDRELIMKDKQQITLEYTKNKTAN